METIESKKTVNGTKEVKRLPGLDVLRLMSVFVVFLFHSHGHIGCSYWCFNSFVNMGAVFMTAFFMSSGFLIYYTSVEADMGDRGGVANPSVL